MAYAVYGYGRSGVVEGFVAAFGLGILQLFPDGLVPTFVCVIVEEIRIAMISKESRNIITTEDTRDGSVKFEDRVLIVPVKGEG